MNNDKLIKGLFSLAWGYLFIHINIEIITVDIFPNWIGYCLLLGGISSLSLFEPSSKLLRPLGILLIIWGVAEWFAAINQITIPINIITVIITVIDLYLHFQLLTNIADIANRCDTMKGKKLLRLRNTRTVLVTIFTLLYPLVSDNYYILMVLGITNLIIGLIIARTLFKFKRLSSLIEITP